MKPKIVASVEARMNSSRFPGKVLQEYVSDITPLVLMYERIRRSKYIDQIFIATTSDPLDDPIIELCKQHNIPFYRGSENNVFERISEGHQLLQSEIIVELTGDCPFIDSKIVDDVILAHLEGAQDYTSNCETRSFPLGMETEVFSLKSLIDFPENQLTSLDREHVSTIFFKSDYSRKNILASKEFNFPDLRLTLDYKEDFLFQQAIFKGLYSTYGLNFELKHVLNYISSHPELMDIISKLPDHQDPEL